MRIYKTLYDCVSETERNLWEMGIEVPLKTMQNKVVEGDPKLGMTKELMGVTFQILEPFKDLEKAYQLIFKDKEKISQHLKWADKEFEERISSKLINPGEAWKIRRETWEPFIVEKNGTFGFEYTYNERLNWDNQLQRIINYLKTDLNSRRAVINIYMNPVNFLDDDKILDGDLIGPEQRRRVPCSVTYSWLYRNGKLNIFYHMRSSDFYTHFINDMYLTASLNAYVAEQLNVPSGILTVYINSLHAYAHDLEERKIF